MPEPHQRGAASASGFSITQQKGGTAVDAPSLGLRLGAEVLGTFLFFFLRFNAVAVATDIGSAAISSLGIAFAFGLGLTLAITALGQVSGGHFNPAVSAGLVAARKFPARAVIPYWAAQLIGGFLAVVVIGIVYSERATDALNTNPGLGISTWGALLLEIITTALFVTVIATVATDERAAWKGVMAPLLIGLFIFTAVTAVGPASGGSYNPARSLDPAIYNGDFGHVWIYLVGPLVGGILGGALWTAFGRTIRVERAAPSEEANPLNPAGHASHALRLGASKTPRIPVMHVMPAMHLYQRCEHCW